MPTTPRTTTTRRLPTRPRALLKGLAGLLLTALASTTPVAALLSNDQAEELYRQGQQSIAEGRYGAAVDQFQALSEQSSAQIDRAIYWKAYAESKAGRTKAALATLDRLTREFPKSAWLDDAQALQLSLDSGRGEQLIRSDDEELKLYALDALQQADPERAVTLLEKFLGGQHSARLQQRALFVLAQTESPRAEQILLRIARDTKSPDLQREAIMALGVSGEESATAALGDIYRSTSDREIKQRVLHALIPADAAKVAADLALAEQDADLQREAIHALGAMGATAELERVAKAVGPDQRSAIYRAYAIAGNSAPLLRALRESTSREDSKAVIEALGILGDAEVGPELLRVYRSSPDREIKEGILSALMVSADATHLLEIFRSEKEPQLKRQALRYLSMLDDPQVQKLIEQIIQAG